MKKITNFLGNWAALLLVLVVAACNTTQKTPASPKAVTSGLPMAKSEKALLWEVTGKGLTQPSFVYGTIHIIPKQDFFMTPSTKKAIASAGRVTFEIDMKEMMNPFRLLGMLGKMRMNGNKRICDLLSPEDCDTLKMAMTKRGLDYKMFERMKPMFISSMFETNTDGEKQEGNNPFGGGANAKTTSYEMEFMKIASEAKPKKKTSGLETMDFQMSMFDSIPYAEQAKMLIKAAKGGGSGDDSFAALVKIYKAQDIEAMAQMMEEGEEGGSLTNYQTLLITKRNKAWIPQMEVLMKEKITFFAVGAGHLGGKEGVVNLLRQAGYTLKPIQ